MHLSDLMDATTLLQNFGGWALGGIALIIFIESGVLFPFLPGDSMLVTAAILRDQLGFWLGHRFGRKLFKPDAKILITEHLEQAEAFFLKYGPLALVLGRFIPIVRTYIPVAAGTAEMPYKKFVGWNVTGAVLWIVSMVGIGVLLGDIPGIADRIDMIAIVIVLVSVTPVVISAMINWRKSKKTPAQELMED